MHDNENGRSPFDVASHRLSQTPWRFRYWSTLGGREGEEGEGDDGDLVGSPSGIVALSQWHHRVPLSPLSLSPLLLQHRRVVVGRRCGRKGK